MKKIDFKFLAVLLIAVFFSNNLSAQISKGGTPPSFNYPNLLRSTIKTYRATLNFDVEQLRKEDQVTDRNGNLKRIAVNVPVDVDIARTGEWTVLPDGKEIWQQKIQAPNAEGLIVVYEDFYIPKGGELFLYTADKSQVIGAYTHETHPQGGAFSTQNLYQDEIILEYVKSSTTDEAPRIKVQEVGYIYGKAGLDDLEPGYSAHCQIDVNCSDGDNWKDQSRGVVHMQMAFGKDWYICSGSLVNNAKEDKTPYILTAWHCFVDGYKTADYATTQYYFFYETSLCKGRRLKDVKVTVGAEPKVILPMKKGSDGALVQLLEKIPEDWDVYYNGWDATNLDVVSGVVIHHPNGDVKKISTFTSPLATFGYLDFGAGQVSASNSHWKVFYSKTENGKGCTEGGSSGSPIFDQSGRIVGTLSGGLSACDSSVQYQQGPNSPDYFGKMSFHWDQYSSSTLHMSTYLDPDNTGVKLLNGLDSKLSIGEAVIEDRASVTIFPNPVSDMMNIYAADIIKSVKVYDIAGRLVISAEVGDSSTTGIATSSLAKGVYSVLIETAKGSEVKKIIRQ